MKRIIIGTLVACIISILPIVGNADTASVPHLLNYQSLLYDDGGNLLVDGSADITFKITDAAGNILYQEKQTPEIVNGAVSVLVGNGLDGSGAPMGGIPESVLDPSSPKFLEVTVDGYPPEATMEIVSVPYAVYAEKALGAVDESITSDALAKKSITIDHFADGLISDLATQMSSGGLIATRTDLTNLQTTYRGTTGASTIGVTGGFVYSGSNNLQGVLQDLDRAIQHRQAGVEAVQTNITNETTARIAGDTTLQTNINNEAASRAAADSAEAAARATADATEAVARDAVDTDHEDRLVALESQSPVKIKAWGTVTGGASPTIVGYNVSISGMDGNYSIGFTDSLASASYAVTVTLQTAAGPGGATAYPVITNKTINGFDISIVNSISFATSFDFNVVTGN